MILKLLTLDGCSRVFEEILEGDQAPMHYFSRLIGNGNEVIFDRDQVAPDREHCRMYRLSHMTTRQPGYINERVFVYVEVLDERLSYTIAYLGDDAAVAGRPAFQKRILRGK